ncbi:MAG: MBL fold metallo-hydrolase [Planctomycetota bacterium]
MPTLEWLGHATMRITDNNTVVYLDPWKLTGKEAKADIILISHEHFDHLSAEDIAKIRKPGAVILCPADCVAKAGAGARALAPGETAVEKGISVKGIPAYNTNKEFHPRKNKWLGFLVTIGGQVFYFAGDTDVIPEMASLGKVDTACLPIGGTYTMTAEEAAGAAKTIAPKRAVPYHWGDIVGSEADAKKFKSLCGCPVDILKPCKP